MLGVLRYNFSSPNFISPLTKIPIQAYKLFWAPTNISNILPKYFPYITQLGLSQIFPILLPNLSSTNISHTSPINYFGPLQIFLTYYPNISHILPNLGSPKYSPYYYPIWALTNISHTSPINYSGPSQIFSILPNLGPQKYLSYHYQNWATKLCHLYKSPNPFTLWAKPKKPNKTLL